jgi:hypothetical protein
MPISQKSRYSGIHITKKKAPIVQNATYSGTLIAGSKELIQI